MNYIVKSIEFCRRVAIFIEEDYDSSDVIIKHILSSVDDENNFYGDPREVAEEINAMTFRVLSIFISMREHGLLVTNEPGVHKINMDIIDRIGNNEIIKNDP